MATVPASFFGLSILSAGSAKTNPPVIKAGITRSWDVEDYAVLAWQYLNTSAGNFNIGAPGSTGTLMDWLTNAKKLGQQTVVTLSGTPAFAGATPATPPNMAAWTAWVTAVSTQCKGLVTYYEIWNEPDDPASWSGTVAQLGALAQTAYPILKANDPSALVLTPCFTEQVGVSTAAVNAKAYFQAGYGQYADLLAIHDYNGNPAPTHVEDLYALIAGYQALTSLPVIVTEGSWGYAASATTGDAAQSAYLIKRFCIGLMLGVKSMIWYAQDNDNAHGALTTNGTLNAAGLAFNQLIAELVGSTVTSSQFAATGTCAVNYTRANGTIGSIAWNSFATVTQPTPGGNSPSVVIGSTPVFITGPAPVVQTPPPVTNGPTINLPYSMSFTGTMTVTLDANENFSLTVG